MEHQAQSETFTQGESRYKIYSVRQSNRINFKIKKITKYNTYTITIQTSYSLKGRGLSEAKGASEAEA